MTSENPDLHFMRMALDLAVQARDTHGEIPVGALVVNAQGEVIGRGFNRNIMDRDPSAHAEMVALREAGAAADNHRLLGCTVYVTLEPCTMCAMAMIHARVGRVVYGAADPKTGAAGSVFNVLTDERHNHKLLVTGGVLAEACGTLLTDFFRGRRSRRV